MGLDGFKNHKEKKQLTSKMLNDVNNIIKKYNIENLEISAKNLFEFEKKILGKILWNFIIKVLYCRYKLS